MTTNQLACQGGPFEDLTVKSIILLTVGGKIAGSQHILRGLWSTTIVTILHVQELCHSGGPRHLELKHCHPQDFECILEQIGNYY